MLNLNFKIYFSDSKKGSLSNNAEDLQLLLEENDGNDYHDEYDDTYDEQMIGIKEVTAWDDGLERKQYT